MVSRLSWFPLLILWSEVFDIRYWLPGATIPTNLTRIPDYLTKTRFSVISCSEKNFHPRFSVISGSEKNLTRFSAISCSEKKLSPAFLANPSRKSYNFFFS